MLGTESKWSISWIARQSSSDNQHGHCPSPGDVNLIVVLDYPLEEPVKFGR